jgi:hypothetical protein
MRVLTESDGDEENGSDATSADEHGLKIMSHFLLSPIFHEHGRQQKSGGYAELSSTKKLKPLFLKSII